MQRIREEKRLIVLYAIILNSIKIYITRKIFKSSQNALKKYKRYMAKEYSCAKR